VRGVPPWRNKPKKTARESDWGPVELQLDILQRETRGKIFWYAEKIQRGQTRSSGGGGDSGERSFMKSEKRNLIGKALKSSANCRLSLKKDGASE